MGNTVAAIPEASMLSTSRGAQLKQGSLRELFSGWCAKIDMELSGRSCY